MFGLMFGSSSLASSGLQVGGSRGSLGSFLTGFSHIFSPDGLNTLFFPGYVLEMATSMGIVGIYIPRTSEGVRNLDCQSPASGST